MYVIRPRFFIPVITLPRNAAMNALAYSIELAQLRTQNIDITHSGTRSFRCGSQKLATALQGCRFNAIWKGFASPSKWRRARPPDEGAR
jgi:hypothetical protein